MSKETSSFSRRLIAFRCWLRRETEKAVMGGMWCEQCPPNVHHNLLWFWLDGVMAQASDNIVINYLSLYLLAWGGTRSQVGLLNAIPNLVAAFVLPLGARLVNRGISRRTICVYGGGGVGRLTLLLLAILPFFLPPHAVIPTAIALAILRVAMGNLSVPAWISFTADVVPIDRRGSYFGSRNLAMTIAGMLATYAAGALITHIGEPMGYAWAMGLAFVLGVGSTLSFSRIHETPAAEVEAARQEKARGFKRRISSTFLIYCATMALWTFAVNVVGPFVNPYLSEELHASAEVIGILSIFGALSGILAQRILGQLSDRWGHRRVMTATGLVIPFVPLAIMLIRSPWGMIPINLVSGFMWGGYNLASFNYLLASTPREERARYSATYQTVVTLAAAGGTGLTGWVADRWGYSPIFITSAALRMLAILAFIFLVPDQVNPED